MAQFSKFNLNNSLLESLAKMGFADATTVQQEVYPEAINGRDLMVSSQTGSGKTIAFLLPIFQQIIEAGIEAPQRRERGKGGRGRQSNVPAKPQAIVMCPTRELAQQVSREAILLKGDVRGFRIATVVGGMPYGRQIRELENVTVLVATPGRLIDLCDRRAVDLSDTKYFIADEADRMLDMGFAEDLKKIFTSCKNIEQTLMFSATFPKNVMRLAEMMMDNPHRIEMSVQESINPDIKQILNWADGREHQQKLLMHWLGSDEIDQAVVFTSTQKESETIADELRDLGVSASFLHGGLQQNVRNRRLDDLRRGRTKILVATDVAARGIDVSSITHVINYGLPRKPEDYIHRIGRTGRAGREGTAITLLHHRDNNLLNAVNRYTDSVIEPTIIEGLEPHKKPGEGNNRPKKGRRGSNQRRRNRGQATAGRRSGGNSDGARSGNRDRGGRRNAS